jgi:hypothetical protein
MKKNVHDVERVLRVAAGVALTAQAFTGRKRPWFLVFLTPILTGLTGKCPVYSALGVSTRPEAESKDNAYFPVQSPAERAAGHPIVGTA